MSYTQYQEQLVTNSIGRQYWIYKNDAFSKTAVDKIGAGDAMLSIIALCIKSGFPEELSLIVSSLAAAQSVKTIGKIRTNK